MWMTPWKIARTVQPPARHGQTHPTRDAAPSLRWLPCMLSIMAHYAATHLRSTTTSPPFITSRSRSCRSRMPMSASGSPSTTSRSDISHVPVCRSPAPCPGIPPQSSYWRNRLHRGKPCLNEVLEFYGIMPVAVGPGVGAHHDRNTGFPCHPYRVQVVTIQFGCFALRPRGAILTVERENGEGGARYVPCAAIFSIVSGI